MVPMLPTFDNSKHTELKLKSNKNSMKNTKEQENKMEKEKKIGK